MKNPLRRLVSRLRQMRPVAEFIDYELRHRKRVTQNHGFSHGLPTVDLFELLPDFGDTIEPYSFLGGSASPIEMAMLKGLARGYERCSYLEIGTFRGESAANVASVAENCVTIALPPEEMRALGYSDEIIQIHGFFSKPMDSVSHVLHNSLTFDYSQLGEKFDLIFIDGDHAPESVKADTRNAFEILRDGRSTIVWHDYGFGGDQIRWSVLAGILDGCPELEKRHLYHVSHTTCAIFSRRQFQHVTEDPSQTPEKKFSVTLSVSDV